MKPVSTSVASLRRSGVRAVMDIAFRTPGVLRLEVGDPDFPTPEHIVEAAARATRDGYTHYTPSQGLPEVRTAMAEKLCTFNSLNVGPDDVVVTAGGGHALFSVYRALCDPGDMVLAPDPGWPNYGTIGALTGAGIMWYPLLREKGFVPDFDALEEMLAAHPNVKMLVVNTPGNPTGAVWGREILSRLVELCQIHDVYLISDECYEAITFHEPHLSPATLDPERTVSVFSVSKTYAMTGWRVGYVTGPREVVSMVGRVVENSVSCAAAVSQKAAEAALGGDQSPVEAMVAAYRSRRDLAMQRLGEEGLSAVEPQGAFYVMVEVPATDTVAFALELVAAEKVTVAPGEAFGAGGSGMVRLSLASEESTIDEGIRRLGRFARSQAAG